MTPANPTQKTSVVIDGPVVVAVKALVLSPPTGDATPQTHMHAYLTG